MGLAVRATDLCRRFGRRWALAGLDLEVEEGSLVMLAGRNGSGKSTLLRVLATALRPDRGRVSVLGHDAAEDKAAVRRHTTILGHRTFLYEPLTAAENLQVTARMLGRPLSREALRESLHRVGLADRADDPLQTFSAGMRQRLALARTLLKDARVVLLDEPYGHLDPPGFRLVDGLIERLRNEGRTLLMATHLLARGRALCDRALVLEGGRVAYFGPSRDLPESEGNEAASAEGGA
jgi:heme exporter protein A